MAMKDSRTNLRRSAAGTTWVATVAAAAVIAATVCVSVLIFAAVVFVRPSVQTVPSGTGKTVGGLRYSVANAWILHPQRSVDARLAKGLPSIDRRLSGHQLLYAVFVGVTNTTDRSRPMASDIALRDTLNREYAPVPLGAENAYAYRPHVMAPKTRRPAPSSPAGRDLSAEGSMLVFRVPRQAYDGGPLELVVHDPAHPDSVSTIEVA
jgi:hypothetical protein